MTKQPSAIKQFSQFFQVPIQALYLIIVFIIVFVGVFVSTSSTQHKQRTEGLASSAEEQTVECNQACEHNHQCPPNHFCFNKLCRLVTNPHSPYCDPLADDADNTIQSASPATEPQVQLCNEPCINNNQCDSNHLCYQGLCRLSSQPEDPTCGQATTPEATSSAILPTPSPITTASSATDSIEAEVPLIPSSPEPEEKATSGIAGLINNFLADSDTSIFFVLGLGLIGLIILVAIVTFVSSRKKIKYPHSNFSQLEQTPQHNQEDNQTIPINPSAETADSNSETQPTYSSTELKLDHNQNPTSPMISRLKEKEIEIPQVESRNDQQPSEVSNS